MNRLILFLGLELLLLHLPQKLEAGGPITPNSEGTESLGKTTAMSALELQLVFPGACSQGVMSSRVQTPAGCELLTLHASDGTKIAGLFGKGVTSRQAVAENTVALPTLLYFYGNGMCMADSLNVFNRFRGLGFNAMMVDYEGYGMSDGSPSESGCNAAADAAYAFLLTRNDVAPGLIISTGWSLGAAVAIDLATRRNVAGVATFNAFTNIAEMGQTIAPNIPIAVLFNSRFDNLAKIATLSCPIFMAHGTNDPIVPPSMLDHLAVAAKTKVTLLRVKGAQHNTIVQEGGDALYHRLQTFVRELPAAAHTTHPK